MCNLQADQFFALFFIVWAAVFVGGWCWDKVRSVDWRIRS